MAVEVFHDLTEEYAFYRLTGKTGNRYDRHIICDASLRSLAVIRYGPAA